MDKFSSNYRLGSSERELIVPSIFMEDDPKRHMSINLENGLWRCFKTGNTGNFITLYSRLESVPYRQAYEKFMFESFIREDQEQPQEAPKVSQALETFEMEKVDPEAEYDDYIMAAASELMHSRHMQDQNFYVAKEGMFKDRLILPFFNTKSEMFFCQARALKHTAYPKYLNARNFKASEVLYPYNYSGFEPLYITEGVFDCLTLKKCGLNATSTLSCMVSRKQMEQLKYYQGKLIVAYDSDSAGMHGVKTFLTQALKSKVNVLGFTTSGSKYKDWNEAYIAGGSNEVLRLIENRTSDLNTLSLAVSSL